MRKFWLFTVSYYNTCCPDIDALMHILLHKHCRPDLLVHQPTFVRSVPKPTVVGAMNVKARVVNGEVFETTIDEVNSAYGRVVDASMLQIQQSCQIQILKI